MDVISGELFPAIIPTTNSTNAFDLDITIVDRSNLNEGTSQDRSTQDATSSLRVTALSVEVNGCAQISSASKVIECIELASCTVRRK